jgi:protein involved in polysaccharide export with SLBB domain
MFRWRFLVFAIIACAVSLPASAQTASTSGNKPDSIAGILRPGDLIRLRIWREPDLSGEFQVDENGVATFPKIGPIKVLDESPESLKEKLLNGYAVYLRNPSVEVTMLRRINVLGAVQKPGLYPVDPTMTIADAVAAAGGATAMGDQHKVELVRDGVRVSQGVNSNTRIGATPLRSGDQIFVPERSFIVRNSGLVATGVSVSASLFIALLSRRK